jgi:predicted esterase
MDYTELMEKTLDMYMKRQYIEAYQFITEKSKRVETIDSQVMNFRYAIAARAGMMDEAKGIFKEAIIDKGYWYRYEYLMSDDDLMDMRRDSEIMELIDLCKERERKAIASSEPELVINESIGGDSKGLLIALHGNQENTRITAPFYHAAGEEGYTIILPQSSQMDCTDAYTWDDLERGYKELTEHVKIIKESDDLNRVPLVVSGFSAGGRLALYGVLKKLFKPKRCILLAPWLPELDEWIEGMTFDDLDGIGFHIIVGSDDEDCLNGSLKLHKHLTGMGYQSKLLEINGMAHRIPVDFGAGILTQIIR